MIYALPIFAFRFYFVRSMIYYIFTKKKNLPCLTAVQYFAFFFSKSNCSVAVIIIFLVAFQWLDTASSLSWEVEIVSEAIYMVTQAAGHHDGPVLEQFLLPGDSVRNSPSRLNNSLIIIKKSYSVQFFERFIVCSLAAIF